MTRDGITFKGYPALIDSGDSVSLRLLDSPGRANAEMRKGLRRLFVLSQSRELKVQVNFLPEIEPALVCAATMQEAVKLKSHLIDLLADRALFREDPKKPSVLPTSESEWNTFSKGGATRIGLAVQDLSELIAPLMKTYQEAKLAVEKLGVAPPLQAARKDARQQLAALTRPGFLTSTPWPWLQQYPRYFRAIKARLEKLLRGGLPRDERGFARLQPFLQEYARRREQHESRSLYDPHLDHFRWMLEEFRVSVFAQELKTAIPISEKWLNEQWARVSA